MMIITTQKRFIVTLISFGLIFNPLSGTANLPGQDCSKQQNGARRHRHPQKDAEPCSGMQVTPHTNVQLTVDLAAKSKFPDSHIKRGFDFDAAIQRREPLDSIPKAKALGMSMIGIFRDLNQFSSTTPQHNKEPFVSYRSRGGAFLGADGEPEEFCHGPNGGIQTRVNSYFLQVIHAAIENDLQIVFQNSGSPVCGLDGGRVQQLFKLDPKREFHGSARFYPIPIREQYQLYSDAVYRWIKMVAKQSGVKNAIWIGTQEPEHTLGFPNGKHSPQGGIKNVEDYAALWSHLAKSLSADGLLVGGLQNNMAIKLAGKNKYYLSLEAMAKHQAPLDFLTIQNYQNYKESPPTWEIISSAKEALARFPEYKAKKILFNRYEPISPDFDNKDHNTSGAIVQALISEKQILNHAEDIYGYLIWIGWQKPQWEKMLGFLNSMPAQRRDLDGGQNGGVDGFVFADQNSCSIAIWNSGKTNQELSLKLKNIPMAYANQSIKAIKGSGANIQDTTLLINAGKIDSITLENNEYLLLSLGNPASKL
jgi:hypothetical protein